MRRTLTVSILVAVATTACGGESDAPAVTLPEGWSVVAEADVAPAQREQRSRATEAQKAMLGRLLARLGAAIEMEGPAASIGVCQGETPEIAQAIADEYDLRIGRTSWRLRNPENTPPDWSLDFIERRVDETAYLTHTDGRLAALFPVHIKDRCLTCHGCEADIPEDVQARLDEHYPEDQATGFTTGMLRGWV
ncbi:MAG: c-type heme family protein, partial [Planctomycetota bacterium]